MSMTTQTLKTKIKLLTGKVSGILTERELAINIGSNHAVAPGMRFKVLAEQPTEIRDPETDDVLGIVDREKIRLKVSEVHERFSICRTYSKADMGLALLEAGNSTLPFPFSKEESYVKKGDRVVQILADEN